MLNWILMSQYYSKKTGIVQMLSKIAQIINPVTENQMIGFKIVAPPRLEREFKV